RGHGESEPHVHARGVALDRDVEKTAQLREGHNLVEVARDFRVLHAEDRTVQVNILASGQLAVKAGSDLEQTSDAAIESGPSLRRFGDAREDFQQCGFACAVDADAAEAFAGHDVKIDSAHGPEG